MDYKRIRFRFKSQELCATLMSVSAEAPTNGFGDEKSAAMLSNNASSTAAAAGPLKEENVAAAFADQPLRRSHRGKRAALQGFFEDKIATCKTSGGLEYFTGDFVYYEDTQRRSWRIGQAEEFRLRRETMVCAVKLFYRTEDVPEQGKQALRDRETNGMRSVQPTMRPEVAARELFICDVTDTVPVATFRGKCQVTHYPEWSQAARQFRPSEDQFFYTFSFNPETLRLSSMRCEIKVGEHHQADLPGLRASGSEREVEVGRVRAARDDKGKVWEELLWLPDQIEDAHLQNCLIACRSITAFAVLSSNAASLSAEAAEDRAASVSAAAAAIAAGDDSNGGGGVIGGSSISDFSTLDGAGDNGAGDTSDSYGGSDEAIGASAQAILLLGSNPSMREFLHPRSRGSADTGYQAMLEDDATQRIYDCLHRNRYRVQEALNEFVQEPCNSASPIFWQEDEERAFAKGIRTYGKNFYRILRELLPHRNMKDLIRYYYYWKFQRGTVGARNQGRTRRSANFAMAAASVAAAAASSSAPASPAGSTASGRTAKSSAVGAPTLTRSISTRQRPSRQATPSGDDTAMEEDDDEEEEAETEEETANEGDNEETADPGVCRHCAADLASSPSSADSDRSEAQRHLHCSLLGLCARCRVYLQKYSVMRPVNQDGTEEDLTLQGAANGDKSQQEGGANTSPVPTSIVAPQKLSPSGGKSARASAVGGGKTKGGGREDGGGGGGPGSDSNSPPKQPHAQPQLAKEQPAGATGSNTSTGASKSASQPQKTPVGAGGGGGGGDSKKELKKRQKVQRARSSSEDGGDEAEDEEEEKDGSSSSCSSSSSSSSSEGSSSSGSSSGSSSEDSDAEPTASRSNVAAMSPAAVAAVTATVELEEIKQKRPPSQPSANQPQQRPPSLPSANQPPQQQQQSPAKPVPSVVDLSATDLSLKAPPRTTNTTAGTIENSTSSKTSTLSRPSPVWSVPTASALGLDATLKPLPESQDAPPRNNAGPPPLSRPFLSSPTAVEEESSTERSRAPPPPVTSPPPKACSVPFLTVSGAAEAEGGGESARSRFLRVWDRRAGQNSCARTDLEFVSNARYPGNTAAKRRRVEAAAGSGGGACGAAASHVSGPARSTASVGPPAPPPPGMPPLRRPPTSTPNSCMPNVPGGRISVGPPPNAAQCPPGMQGGPLRKPQPSSGQESHLLAAMAAQQAQVQQQQQQQQQRMMNDAAAAALLAAAQRGGPGGGPPPPGFGGGPPGPGPPHGNPAMLLECYRMMAAGGGWPPGMPPPFPPSAPSPQEIAAERAEMAARYAMAEAAAMAAEQQRRQEEMSRMLQNAMANAHLQGGMGMGGPQQMMSGGGPEWEAFIRQMQAQQQAAAAHGSNQEALRSYLMAHLEQQQQQHAQQQQQHAQAQAAAAAAGASVPPGGLFGPHPHGPHPHGLPPHPSMGPFSSYEQMMDARQLMERGGMPR